MIRLTLVGPPASAVLAATSAYFRVTGGVVWVRPGDGPIATYEKQGWWHKDVLWSGMRFEGPCRLIFGLPRDPTSISEVLQSVSISGRALSANAIPFAVYDETSQIWRGVTAGSWWPAFRIEIADLRKSVRKPTLLDDVIQVPGRPEIPKTVPR
jgi:hypothetical protein